MDTLSIAGQMILSLSILVVLHECGHFFPAKWFKTRVEKFYLFFNPGFSLFKKQIGETEYGIGWVPFGGYVKISGMIDESMDTEQMKQEPQPYEFRSKPAWQRLIIMVGGVTVNFILGVLIFAGILWYFGTTYIQNDAAKFGIEVSPIGEEIGLQDGDKVLSIGDYTFEKFEPSQAVQEIVLNDANAITIDRGGKRMDVAIPEDLAQKLTKYENKGVGLFSLRYPQKVKKTIEGSPAEQAGLQPEDQIISINNIPTPSYSKFEKAIAGKEKSDISIGVIRNGNDTLNLTAAIGEDGKFGMFSYPGAHFIDVSREKYSLSKALPAGVSKSVGFLRNQIKAFGQMFSGKIKATDSLGSVFSIASMFDPGWDWERFWRITAMLSILLGFFNLLPIPALDGGYVMFLLWEVITGRKPNDKVMEYATMVGFFILIGLMIFALGLDVSKWFR